MPTGTVLHVMEATIGGTKRHLLELAGGLRAVGWGVEVACPRVRDEALDDVSFWDDLQAAGIPSHAVAMSRRPLAGANGAALVRLAALIRRRRYAVVHAHSSIAGALARPAALLSGRRPRLVYTPHGFAFLTPGAARRAAFLAVERALGRVTDRLIALTPTEAATAAESGIVPPRRIVTIPNGVVSAQIPRRERALEVRRREGWEGAPVVGTLARMTPQKRPDVWLRTAARIAQARPDVRFAWIWGGEQEQAVRAQARELGLEDRVRFLGYRPDARELIAAFDVFLLTSAFEGLPYSLIEAMAAGVPVVATDVVGTRDVVRPGETGLLAPAGDAPALATHVLHLLAAPAQAHRLAAAGRADVLARYSVAEMVRRTAELYRSLLGA
jgi:glycosyltransferase involved in cell wall biosynthesis